MEIILKKRDSFRAAYSGFDPALVAEYGDTDIERLLGDAGIIRNRLKIHAAISNAREILAIRDQHGSFAEWLDAHHPRHKADWVKLFRTRFRFVGGEIVGEFLMSLGYLPGAHDANCPTHAEILGSLATLARCRRLKTPGSTKQASPDAMQIIRGRPKDRALLAARLHSGLPALCVLSGPAGNAG